MVGGIKQALEPSRLLWAAEWQLNDVPLPMDIPVPMCTPHELCRRAAKQIRRHARVKPTGDGVLLHWALGGCGLMLNGGDSIKLMVKGSYRLAAPDLAASTGSGQHTVRFYTCERKVYLPKHGAGMTAVLRSGTGGRPRAWFDCHQAGAYALEVEQAFPDEEEPGGMPSGRLLHKRAELSTALASQTDAPGHFRLVSLTLRIDADELRHELSRIRAMSACSGGHPGPTALHRGARARRAISPQKAPAVDADADAGADAVPKGPLSPKSALAVEMVRNLDTGEVIHVSEVDERVAVGTPPHSLRPLASPNISLPWIDWLLGRQMPAGLELSCQPIPPLCITGESLTGCVLRLHVARDRFAVGDGLARHVAASIRQVTWRRQRCAAEAGELLKTGAADGTYSPCADDVGCMISATWTADDRRTVSAQTARVQPHPSVRDEVSSLISARKASFELHRVRRDASLRKATLRLDGAGRNIELSWQTSVSLRRSKSKPFSCRCRIDIDAAHPTRFHIAISTRRIYGLQAKSELERDLIALTFRAFLEAFPTDDRAPLPLVLGEVTAEEAEAHPPRPGGSRAPLPAAQRLPGSSSSGGPVLLQTELLASAPRCLHASGVEYSWYRTSRAGVRTLIADAAESSYTPSADDFGCTLMVELTPYLEMQGWQAQFTERVSDGSDDSDVAERMCTQAAPSRQRVWGKPVYKTLAQEARLPLALETQLQRMCIRAGAEFRVLLLPEPGSPRTLCVTRTELQLKAGWTTEARLRFTQHLAVSIQGPSGTVVHIEAGDCAGSDAAARSFRCATESVEQRDLLVLLLRFSVARLCIEAVHDRAAHI